VASEELENSLRKEIDSYVNARLNGLQEEIKRLQNQLNEAFSRLSERATSSTQSDVTVGASILEHMRAAHERGVEDAAAESPRIHASSDIAILKVAAEELDDQRTQADILNALVNRAASFAPRIAFFVVKNEQTIGWRARGLQGTVGDNAVRDIALPLTANTVLSDVVNTRATWSGSPGSHPDNNQFISRLGEEPPQRIAAIPLIARGKAVAVLYADSAALESDAISLEALETLVRVAGMAVELLAVARPAPAERPAARIEPTPQREPVAVTPEPDEEVTLTAPQEPESDITATHPVEEVAIQPVEPAPQFANPLGTARRYSGSADAELPVEVSDDERPQHVGARRFAKLLVSEINLYNESKVKEGRDAGDLYGRLRDTIDRSREMYNKRYSATVGSQFDYFHHELVNTLAEGDESKLGEGYPGASA
jgi:hypothetical protein